MGYAQDAGAGGILAGIPERQRAGLGEHIDNQSYGKHGYCDPNIQTFGNELLGPYIRVVKIADAAARSGFGNLVRSFLAWT